MHAFRRSQAGSTGHNPRSRFVEDIPEEMVDLRGRKIATNSEDVRPARNRWVTWDEFDERPSTRRTSGAARGDDYADPNYADGSLQVQLDQGQRVRHEAFGMGTVVANKQRGADSEVTVDFEDAGIKKLLLSLAPLEKV